MGWDAVITLDREATLALNGLGGGWIDDVMVFASHKLTWVPLYAALIVFLFYRLGWKRALVFLAAAALTFLACDQLSNVFKYGFERLRPCHNAWMTENGLRVLERRGGYYGFFSAHAANVFGVACCVLPAFLSDRRLRYRGLAAGLFTWATLVSVSRVFVGKHFLGDVLVGALIGTAVGLAMGHLARWVIRRRIH